MPKTLELVFKTADNKMLDCKFQISLQQPMQIMLKNP